MIPKVSVDLTTFKEADKPHRTFFIDFAAGRIKGKIEGLEAVKQAAELILMTERYEYLIHSWNYGVEFANLIGKPRNIAIARLESRISEALLTDSRIRSVDDFSHTASGNVVTVKFTVQTIYGDFEAQKEVIL